MKSFFCTLITLCILPFSMLAQQHSIKKIKMEDGISNNYVISVTQDKKGFLWFATESGLNRFDGSKFKVYKKNNLHLQSSISGNELNKVYADKFDDVVWVATQREGLNMFDYATETFTHYKHDTIEASGIITNDITDITNSKDGNLWLSTYYRGVEYFNKKDKTFTHYNSSTIPNMASDKVWCVKEDQHDFLYIGHVSSGLSILSLKDKKIKNLRHNPNDKESLPGNDVRSIFIDTNDNVWIGTNKGLALLNKKKGSFTVFNHDPNNNQSLISNYIFSITQLTDGKLWIGTENGGVSILDLTQSMFLSPENVKFTNISNRDDDSGFSNPTIRSVFQDSFENIWLGTYGGGVNFISHTQSFFKTWKYSPFQTLEKTLNNSIAWGITVDSDDRMWIGTDGGGINVFEDGKRIKVFNKSSSKLTDDAILSATRDSKNNLWFGTFNGGVNIFDVQTKTIYKLNIGDKNLDIRCLYEDENQNMWIGSNQGLYKYNLNTKKTELFSTNNSDLSNNFVRAISVDNEGKIWVGFFGEGLAILDKNLKEIKKFKTDNGFPSNSVDHIYKDTKGQIWIASGEGLVSFKNTKNLNQYEVFDEQNGLSNSYIRAITEDDSGNLWVSTNGGISRLVPLLDKFYNYDRYNGVPLGDFMSGSVTKDSKGMIFFGSQNGVCFFDPKSISSQINLAPTVITGFKIYSNLVEQSNKELNIPTTSTIELNYDQNTFNISFNILDYSLNQLTDYSYKLKGLEDLWYSTEGENSVTFRNIPHGTYELLIKSKIQNQEWTSNITTLKIIINPPFWLTWWAKILYLILSLAILYFIMHFYKRKLNLENSLILEKRNYIQEQELNTEKLRFFTNITHELRTPLTLILGPLEDLQCDKTLSEKHSSKISLIYRSATRLLTLINQILEFRKTETQNKKLAVQKGNLSQLIQEIGLKYKELNSNKKIVFETICESEKSDVFFDPDIISTILENLLSNAFKYTQVGNINLILRNITEDGLNYIEIEVSDTGRGIASEAISKIFDRYYQAGGEQQVSGTGIGLALVHNLVDIHQGTITAESEVGKGTSFRFRILSDNTYPDARHLETTTPTIVEELLPNNTTETTNTKPIALVIEDNDEIRNYIKNSLIEEYQVYTATNGKQGLEQAYTYIPDIIISDVMMPEMDGFELSRIIKEDIRTSHIPIIILTAKDSIQDKTEGYAIGVESYISKPFSASLLRSRIVNLLEARKKQAEIINKNTTNKNTIIIDSLNKIDNEFIEKITSIIENNLDSEKIDVAFIADQMNMSHSTLYRKIKALSGISVNEFIRKIRISNAEKLLLTGKYTISEISYMIGINSLTYFRQCFKEEFGMTPSDYLKQIMNNNEPENDI